MRKNLLWISVLVLLIGMAATVLAYAADYVVPGWTDFYETWVPGSAGSDWNLWVRVLAPIVLLTGLWYVGEQWLARRKFGRLLREERKGEFTKNVAALESTAKRLPKKYERELQEKEASFKSKR